MNISQKEEYCIVAIYILNSFNNRCSQIKFILSTNAGASCFSMLQTLRLNLAD